MKVAILGAENFRAREFAKFYDSCTYTASVFARDGCKSAAVQEVNF